MDGVERGARKALAVADRWMNRVYGSRWNPLYASGAIVVGLLAVLLITGLYLLLFYRIGDPYGSVEAITGQAWLGRWIRSLHRYASDVAVVAIVVHAFRMFAQGRSWGPRALAWVSGLILTFVVLVSGWTGYVMVWDWQGWMLAAEGARWLDVLPLFSEPISRLFVGTEPIPAAFFFLNLFLHVALPIGVGLVLWLHVSRVARPTLLPPPGLRWGLLGLLIAVSVLWPIGMAGEADPLRLPGDVELDLFYSFWLPLTWELPAWVVWAGGSALAAAAMAVPWMTRPPEEAEPPPSFVDERVCTGCSTCYEDCPYEAIAMVPRAEADDTRSTLVARVDPALCVSCGICSGSCAPMGVGPVGRTGRDQLQAVKTFVKEQGIGDDDGRAGSIADSAASADSAAEPEPAAAGGPAGTSVSARPAGPVVVVGCDRGAVGAAGEVDGAVVYPVTCAGNLHTSVVEYLVRSGAAGVFIVACPERDCWSREGPKWVEQRLYHDREAELQDRVDRRRVRLVNRAAGEDRELAEQLAAFRADLARLERTDAEEEIDLVALCETDEGVAVSVLEEAS